MRTGTVEAATEVLAYDMLQEHGLIVIKIIPAGKVTLFSEFAFLDRVSLKDLVLFSRQLSTLINAKVPIVTALRVLKSQVSSRRLQKIIDEVTTKVENGDSLSSALAAYPKIFSDLYINMIKSGELAGSMDESLMYLANQLEKDYDLRSKIISSLTYPAFIVVALFVVGILMFIYVLPPLVSILQEQAVSLPFTTKILIAITNAVQHYWWLLLILLAGLIVGVRSYIQTTDGRYVLDYVKLHLPVFGKLFKNIYLSRFSRNLATLVAGGIPIVRALDSVADTVGNQIYKDIIHDAAYQVKNGKTIASSLSGKRDVPEVLAQMTQIGEQTGNLQDIMAKIASFYEKEVESMLRVLTTLIEPLIMMLLGLAVAVMVAGILLPIYNLASTA